LKKNWWTLNKFSEEEDLLNLEMIFNSTGKKEQLITFKIEDVFYGIEISKIREVTGYPIEKPPKPVPNLPDYIMGIINLRGEMIPVLELKKKMGLSEKQYNKFSVILIIEDQEDVFGIVCDEVEEVIPFPEEKIDAPPEYIHDIDTSFIKFLGGHQNKIIHILDTEKILNMEDKKNLKKVLS